MEYTTEKVRRPHSNRKLISVLVVIVAALSPLALWQGYTSLSSRVRSQRAPFASVGSLPEAEYQEIIRTLSDLVVSEDPTAALTTLNALMNTDQRILRECHGFVHEIGRTSYRKYNDFSTVVKYQDDLCGSGYLHGAIEENFSNTKDISLALKTLCAQYGLSAQAGKCYHGVGHGLMYYSNNNLPLSIAKCGEYRQPRARIRCAEGVYMENFSALRDLHPSPYLKPDDPFYPCAEQPAEFKGVCYYYAPVYYLDLHPNAYVDVLTACAGVESNYQSSCVKGLGSRVMKYNIRDIAFAETVCMSGTQDQRLPCIDGMVSYYIVNFNAVLPARLMCHALEGSNQEYCLRSVEKQKNLASD